MGELCLCQNTIRGQFFETFEKSAKCNQQCGNGQVVMSVSDRRQAGQFLETLKTHNGEKSKSVSGSSLSLSRV